MFDEETEDYYCRSRYFYPSINRFISSDILVDSNLYEYCGNSPITSIDRSGKYGEYLASLFIPDSIDLGEFYLDIPISGETKEGYKWVVPRGFQVRAMKNPERADVYDIYTYAWYETPDSSGWDLLFTSVKYNHCTPSASYAVFNSTDENIFFKSKGSQLVMSLIKRL